MKKPKLVIVGLGMAASRLLDELVKSNTQQDYDIVVFGEESVGVITAFCYRMCYRASKR